MITVNTVFIIAILGASSLAVILATLAANHTTTYAISMSIEDVSAFPESNPNSKGRSSDLVNSILNASIPHLT